VSLSRLCVCRASASVLVVSAGAELRVLVRVLVRQLTHKPGGWCRLVCGVAGGELLCFSLSAPIQAFVCLDSRAYHARPKYYRPGL